MSKIPVVWGGETKSICSSASYFSPRSLLTTLTIVALDSQGTAAAVKLCVVKIRKSRPEAEAERIRKFISFYWKIEQIERRLNGKKSIQEMISSMRKIRLWRKKRERQSQWSSEIYWISTFFYANCEIFWESKLEFIFLVSAKSSTRNVQCARHRSHAV